MKLPLELFRISILKTITKAIFITFPIILLTQHALAQFQDNFSDKDLTTNPMWAGDVGEFTVNTDGVLQVNASTGGSVYLASAFNAASIDDFEWRVLVKQSFSPSANNFGRVYLTSDQEDLRGAIQGYYVQFGESGSNDAVELFRQSGATHVSVCRASTGGIASAFEVRVKVIRKASGVWTLSVDYSGGSNFTQEATGTDNTYSSSAFLGVTCTFTASNAHKFYYDDFYMGPITVDVAPPVLLEITSTSTADVILHFDEPIDAATSATLTNYEVAPSIHPTSATLDASQQRIQLQFNPPLINGTFRFNMNVSGVKDKSGNTMVNATKAFVCFDRVPPVAKDIILTEFLPDPDPKVGLPENEFVELYNRSGHPFDLLQWSISDGNSTATMPAEVLMPDSFLILSTADGAVAYQAFGKSLGISSFPSLNNSGDMLVLRDNQHFTIDSLQYDNTWFRDEEKKNGGWTLEIIDPANTCAAGDNWIASENLQGGTPGQINSVLAQKPDLTGPHLLSVIPVAEQKLIVKFNERLNASLPLSESFHFTPALVTTAITFEDASRSSILLTLQTPLAAGITYRLALTEIYDCAGNIIDPEHLSVVFGMPEAIDSLDVLVNEILFDPRPTGVDFVEFYNASDHFLNMKNWSLANMEEGLPINVRMITPDNFLLAPGELIVFTENSHVVKGEYIQGDEDRFFKVASLPGMNNDTGSIALLDSTGKIIDVMFYSEKMHSTYLKNPEGVSLERVNGAAGAVAWQSASSLSGFATPGYVNSASVVHVDDQAVKVVPEIFEPTTGNPSATDIVFSFDRADYVGNVKILDTEGRIVKQLSNNDLLGAHGALRWDGTNDDGSVAKTGYYLVWFEVFNDSGSVHTFRRRLAVVHSFR